MVLESTMICLDNSEWMRNGDYVPCRLDAQQDAASMICNDRTNSNAENTVGLLTMAGQGVNLLVSPTEEIGKILAAFALVNIDGTNSDLSTAVQIAQLALKHRKNKNGGQRIIAFVGGPLSDSATVFQKIGKNLKKNNVAIDVICMGEINDNLDKLTELVNSANSNDNSHLVTVPPGVSPVNALLSSALMQGSGTGAMMGGGGGGGGTGDFDMYGGIDPEMDPELAMAIRVSTEEARAEQEARLKALGEQQQASTSVSDTTFNGDNAIDEDDEEALIQRALEMSMKDVHTPLVTTLKPELMSSSSVDVAATMDVVEDDEDADLRHALQLSVGTSSTDIEPTSQFLDADFVNQLLAGDSSDPLIQAALAQMGGSSADQEGGADGEGANNKQEHSKKRKGDDK